jgi:hypothetical protein
LVMTVYEYIRSILIEYDCFLIFNGIGSCGLAVKPKLHFM